MTEETELAADGNHYSVYSANLDRLELSLEDGAFDLELTYREEDVADRFTRMWEGCDDYKFGPDRRDERLRTVHHRCLFLVALMGAIIAYQAYRGYRRNDATSMLYLALGLLLLTVCPFLVNVTITTVTNADHLVTVFFENVSRLLGLVAIMYSLYGRH